MLTFNETAATNRKLINVSFTYNSVTYNGATPLTIAV